MAPTMTRRVARAVRVCLCLLAVSAVPDGYSFLARLASLWRNKAVQQKASNTCEGLPGRLLPKEVEGLDALRKALGQTTSGLEPLADPLTLLRFYRARNREVDAAAEMYKSTMQWRSSYSISEVMDDFGSAGHFGKDGGRITDPAEWTWLPHANTREAELAYRHAFFTRLPAKHSGELQPVLIWRAGHADYKGIVREELVDIMIKAFVVHLEDALQASRAASFKTGEMVRARLIVDCEGLGMDNIRYIPILKKIITLGKSYYPEVAETVTVIRAPGFCTMFYNLVKPLLPKLLQKKIYLLSQNFHEGLIQHTGLDPKSLPQFLGGDRTDGDFPEVLPVPENALKFES